MTSVVRLLRGDTVESEHQLSVAVAEAGGRLTAQAGNPELVTYYRSSAKPLQALPLVEDGVVEAWGIKDAELAITCASHNAEPAHVMRVESLLRRADLGPDALECGAHAPYSEVDARALVQAGQPPTRLHNNCSGKHAGMLALARFHGWPTLGYVTSHHPVQRRMLTEVARWTERAEASIAVGVDGCGVSCFAISLADMARSYARFAAAAARGEGAARITGAMMANPFEVAGTGRLCTALMSAQPGLFAKVGAEGVYCVGVPDVGVGVAVKAHDGGKRAGEVGVIEVLALLGLLSSEAESALASWRVPAVYNTLDQRVGELRAFVSLATG